MATSETLPTTNPRTHTAIPARAIPQAIPARPCHLDTPVSFRLDSDIRLACEDQAQAQGIPWQDWLQQTMNDSLRAYLGI